MRQGRTRLPVAVTAGLAASVTALAGLAIVLLGPYDAVDLLYPGGRGQGGEVMAADFGSGEIPDRYAYDGQQTYVFSRDFPHLTEAVDDGVEAFRLRRVLQPAIASFAGKGEGVVLLLALTNAIGVGLATGGLIDIALRNGRSVRAGYGAVVGLAFPLLITTTEPLAFGLGFVGLALAERRRVVWAGAALALAALTRETALIMAIAAGIGAIARGSRRHAGLLVAIPLMPYLAWTAVLGATVGWTGTQSRLLGVLHLPSLGPTDLVVDGVVLGLMIFGVVRWRDVPSLWAACAGFLASCAIYLGDAFEWEAFARVSAAGVALGVASFAGPSGGVSRRR